MKEVNSPVGLTNLGYQRLRGRLVQTGWIALGSVLERNLPGQGGPRYQWSQRAQGKTVTVALSVGQSGWLKRAIANQRRVESLLSRMRRLAIDYMGKHLPSTSRRKRLSNKTLGLNELPDLTPYAQAMAALWPPRKSSAWRQRSDEAEDPKRAADSRREPAWSLALATSVQAQEYR